MKTPTIFLTLLLAAAPALADAQLDAAAKRYGYGADVVAQVDALVAEAAAAGVAAEPLRTKAVEGMAKRVPAKQLVEALRKQRDRLVELKSAAPAAKSPASQRAALTALNGGLSAGTVAAVSAAAKGDAGMQAGLYAAGVLVKAGVDEASAASFAVAQLAAGLSPAEIDGTTQAAARAARAGLVSGSDLAAVKPADLQGDRRERWLAGIRGFEGAPAALRERDTGDPALRAAESKRVQERRDLLAKPPGAATPPPPKIDDKPGDNHDDDEHDDEDKPEYEHDRKK